MTTAGNGAWDYIFSLLYRYERVRTIMDALDDDPAIEIVIDVVDRRVAIPAIALDEPFVLDDYTQHRLLEGLDDIGITETHRDDIAIFETKRPEYLPSTR